MGPKKLLVSLGQGQIIFHDLRAVMIKYITFALSEQTVLLINNGNGDVRNCTTYLNLVVSITFAAKHIDLMAT